MNGDQAQQLERMAEELNVMEIGFKRLSENAVLPTKVHVSDAGLDLYAAKDVRLLAGQTVVIPTDLAIDLPPGYMATVRPRSGLSARTQFRVIIGTIDAGFTGNIGVIAENSSTAYIEFDAINKTLNDDTTNLASVNYDIKRGDKIAQLVVQQLPQTVAVEIMDELAETDRGGNGFGSSGV